MHTVLSLNTGLKYGEADSQSAILHWLKFSQRFVFSASPAYSSLWPMQLFHRTAKKMTALSQDPGSYKQEIEKRQILVNPISQNGAKFLSINWPNVPEDFAILVPHILQNTIFKKVSVDLQKFKWTGQERAKDQLWRPKKITSFHYRINISSKNSILNLTYMAPTKEHERHASSLHYLK